MNLIKLIPCIYKRFWPGQPLYFRFWILKKYIYVHECCQANQNSSIDPLDNLMCHMSLILGRIIKVKVFRHVSSSSCVVTFFFLVFLQPCKSQNCWKSTPSDSPILSIFCRLNNRLFSSRHEQKAEHDQTKKDPQFCLVQPQYSQYILNVRLLSIYLVPLFKKIKGSSIQFIICV